MIGTGRSAAGGCRQGSRPNRVPCGLAGTLPLLQAALRVEGGSSGLTGRAGDDFGGAGRENSDAQLVSGAVLGSSSSSSDGGFFWN